VGVDIGAFVSLDGGVSWNRLGTWLPDVAVNQIAIDHTGSKILAATEGRGMWILPFMPTSL
jgi:hypothetical protein